MAAANDEPESKFEEASTTLSEGLETCRVVVGTYRELLGGEKRSEIQAAANEDTEVPIETPEIPIIGH